MRILVTGHDGYIGSAVTPALKAAGHDVVGLDVFYYERCGLEQGPSAVPAFRVDVRDIRHEQLAGFDAVVHLAALSNDPLGDLDAELTRDINLRGTVRLAEAAKRAGVERFVFASSCSMYGAYADAPVDEEAELMPLTAYAESKVLAERALAELAGARFSPVSMRNATAFGVSTRLRTDLVLNNLVGWGITTGQIRILSDGTPWRPLVHVRDIADATVAVLEAPRELVHGAAFNIGRDENNYRVLELAEVAREAVGDCSVHLAGRGDPDPRSYRVSFRKFADAFPDLRVSWDAERGAAELATAYRAAELTETDFLGGRYVRLKRIRELLDEGSLDETLRWRTAVGSPA